MTLTLTEILLSMIAGALLVMAGLLVWMAVGVWPELRRLMRSADAVLADIRKTVGRIDGIAETVETGAALARQVLAPAWARVGALVSGAARGFRALLRRDT
mgnify:CR=1 FL=1